MPAAFSTYGFQKLATEYFALGGWQQYQLPYTIVRPFNCVGAGEKRALATTRSSSGNVTLAMSHVVPDLVQKVLKGQDPLQIWARAIRCGTTPMAAISRAASAFRSKRSRRRERRLQPFHGGVHHGAGPGRIGMEGNQGRKPFRFESDDPSPTTCRCASRTYPRPSASWAIEATTTLDAALDEIIPWIRGQIRSGGM